MNTPVVLHLKIPRNNEKGPQAMENTLSSLAELFREQPTIVSLELVFQNGFLYFFIVCELQYADLIKGQIYAQYPNTEIETAKDYLASLPADARVGIIEPEHPDIYSIAIYKELDTDFLNSVNGISSTAAKTDFVMIQIVLAAINKKSLLYKTLEYFKRLWFARLRKNSSKSEFYQLKEWEKSEKPLFKTVIRIAASSTDKTRSTMLVSSVAALFKTLRSPELNGLELWKKTTGESVLSGCRNRQLSGKIFTLAADEIATIYHLPPKEASVTQVSSARSRSFEPPANLPPPEKATPFAATTFHNDHIPFGINREDRRKHLYIIGKTGVGKSKLIELLALSDIREGKGCIIMDPHGDLAEELLRYIPRNRLYDIIYFNPADSEFPMSFNPLEGATSYEFKQTVVSGFIAIFKKLFSFTWNQRLEHVLRYTTLALMDIEGATVLSILKMLTDNRYRQFVITKIQDPLVKKFWTTEFSAWNDQYAGEAVTPIINKVGQFVANPVIRNIVGQSKSSIKIDEIINSEKILIANFAIGKLGEENSALLGAMFVTKLWQAAVARTAIPESDRKDAYLYIDEFQNFATTAFGNILSEARKYRLNLTVAHQHMKQLPEEIRSTIFGNIGSLISFRIGGEDAAVLEKEFSPVVSPEDFMNLDARNFYIKLSILGQTVNPFSGVTLNFPNPYEDLYSDVVKISRERWSRPKAEVEEEIASFEKMEETLFEDKKETISKPAFTEPIV